MREPKLTAPASHAGAVFITVPIATLRLEPSAACRLAEKLPAPRRSPFLRTLFFLLRLLLHVRSERILRHTVDILAASS